jgi:tripartite-type tricarboxylate transporter receptor subunit TctC
VLVVHPSVKATTVPELVAFAKANPGQLTYASSGPGTPYHMAGELFKAMSGTDILHVPHRSSGEARADVMGGHVQMMFDAVTAMKGNIEAGEVRALATTGLERSVVLPDLPTVNEAGVPGYEATIWLGLMAPAGTPRTIVDRMNEEVVKIIGQPEIRAAWARQGAVPMTMTPAAFDTFLRGEIQKWAKVVEISGAKIQ